MAADLWQLINGWSLVDWSLNVGDGGGGGEPDGSSRGGYAFPKAQQFRPPKRQLPKFLYDDDDVAIALALALLT